MVPYASGSPCDFGVDNKHENVLTYVPRRNACSRLRVFADLRNTGSYMSHALAGVRKYTTWDCFGVKLWLREEVGLSDEQAQLFFNHEIDGSVIDSITCEDMEWIGLRTVGARLKIKRAVQELVHLPTT